VQYLGLGIANLSGTVKSSQPTNGTDLMASYICKLEMFDN